MNHGIDYPRSQALINWAVKFADAAHGDQVRKYSGERYIVHPIEVAKKVMTAAYYDIDMVVAAILHDVIEDTPYTETDLRANEYGFSFNAIDLAVELTDVCPKDAGNRAFRKAQDCKRLATVSNKAKTVKLADIICNSKSIIREDPNLAKVWMVEMSNRLEVLVGGDEGLWNEAEGIVNEYFVNEYFKTN